MVDALLYLSVTRNMFILITQTKTVCEEILRDVVALFQELDVAPWLIVDHGVFRDNLSDHWQGITQCPVHFLEIKIHVVFWNFDFPEVYW